MIITFLALTSANPIGGAGALYEVAHGMRRRGHAVHLIHMGLDDPIVGLEDLPWSSFEDGIEHVFPGERRPLLRVSLDDGTQHVFPAEQRRLRSDDDLPVADFIAAYDEQIP